MKLLIFGSTGATGKQLVKQALEQGHIVTAFARNPIAVKREHNNLEIVKGDILNYKSVENAVKGKDVIISALGLKILKKNTIISDGTKNIIKAMEDCGVKRLICMSSIGVGNSIQQKKELGFLYKYTQVSHPINSIVIRQNIFKKVA